MTVDHAIQEAIQHHQAGRFPQAEQIYQQILQQQPDHADALHLMGLLASHRGQLGAAVEWIAKAIRASPDAVVYHSNLGEVFRKLRLLDEAEAACRRAIRIAPSFAPAHINLGVTLYDCERWKESEDALRRGAELELGLERDTLVMRAHALLQLKQLEHAEQVVSRAVALMPDASGTHYCVGAVHEAHGRFAEAEAEYRRSVEIDPRFGEGWRSLGLVVRRKGGFAESVECWKRAIAIQPDHVDAHWNLGLGLLAAGDFAGGWPLFEWRFRTQRTRHLPRQFPGPRWTGFDITGKTILLYEEQGFGDVIQFARFIPQIAARAGKVVVRVPDELVELIATVEGVDRVGSKTSELSPFDVHQSLLSLPLVLGTTLKNLPSKVPYLRVDPKRHEAWSRRIGLDASALKVGLAWAGRPAHANDKQRSITPALLAPLADVSGVRFFSLQKGDSELPFEMVDLKQDLTDFAETAAAIANLDLVIGIDSAVIHLAGALGARVWTLLPFAPDWRWMLDRDDSPWYPTMRLYRQRSAGDWPDVIRRVRGELLELSKNRHGPEHDH